MTATLRVVLAPRATVDARRLLGEAAALARALDAELAAVFVEESDLLHAVELPFTVEVGLMSGAARPADLAATRRLLARHADELRGFVEQTAAKHDLAWSFAVTSGDLVAEALDAASGDLVLIAPRSPVRPARSAASARRDRPLVAVLQEPRAEQTLPGQPGPEQAGPEQPGPEQPGREQARTQGPRPAAVHGRPDETNPSAEPMGAEPTGAEPIDRVWSAAIRLAGGRPDAVARVWLDDLARQPSPGVLVVSMAAVAERPDLLDRVLAAARCPVVLVR